jgi:hypothetical protein
MIRGKSRLMAAAIAAVLGLGTAPARADLMLGFTDSINFTYTGGTGNISDLAATADFKISGNTLTIVLNNESSTAEIAGLFFNAANVTSFTVNTATTGNPPVNITPAPTIPTGGEADGYGSFGWELTFGSSQADRLPVSTIATITATFAGTLTEADLAKTVTKDHGANAGVLDWKPLVGDTGFGGGNVVQTLATPEPPTLIGAGIAVVVGLGIVWRRKRAAA